MNQLTLRHGGVETQYSVVNGGFDITSDAKLHFSVESEIADEEDDESPRELLICLLNCDFSQPTETIRVTDKHEAWNGADHGLPHAFVYTGFHHEIVSAQLLVLSHDDNQMEIDLTVITDDIQYYDERAKRDAIIGHLLLERTAKEELWRP